MVYHVDVATRTIARCHGGHTQYVEASATAETSIHHEAFISCSGEEAEAAVIPNPVMEASVMAGAMAMTAMAAMSAVGYGGDRPNLLLVSISTSCC